MNITITIITAAWRAENLPKVIESVNNQTYKKWQHILVNDNNPDVRDVFKNMCGDVMRFWIDLGVRTHYYGAIARNIGAMAAFSYLHERDLDNEFICFHDDDNLWQPNHLQTMVDAVIANPTATLVASDAIWVGFNDKGWQEYRPCKIRQGAIDLGQLMWKNSLFKKYGYFDPRPRRKQKYDFELIEKMVDGEGNNFIKTNLPTFLMSYRKK